MLRTRGLASGLCRVFMLTCRPAILILAELFLALGAVRNTTFAADVVAPNGARQPPDSDDGQWLRAAKNFASTRFSALRQIDTRNVKDRKVAWTFSTAETGKELWKTKLGDINTGETMTMAPLVVRDKVYVGNSGSEFGVRGWIAALKASDGDLGAAARRPLD